MALTNAEKQKRWREKQKLLKSGELVQPAKPDPVDLSFLLHGFGEWIRESEERSETVGQLCSGDCFRFLLNDVPEPRDQIFTGNLISMFEEAIQSMAGLLHEFRIERINAEIERIDNEEIGEDSLRSRAIEKIYQLKAIAENMQRNTRIEISGYQIPELYPILEARAKELNAVIY